MSRLNAFQKDLLVLVAVFVVHILVTTLFSPRSVGLMAEAGITSHWFVFRFEDTATQTVLTFYPILPFVYAGVILLCLLRKEKPLTLIYGLAIVLLAQTTFYSQLAQLEGVHTNVAVEGFLFPIVRVDDTLVAQDASSYVLLTLMLIKGVIVAYTGIKKRMKEKRGNPSRRDGAPYNI